MISSAVNGTKATNGTDSATKPATNGTSSCRDGNDYLKILNRERDYLLAVAEKLENEIEELLKADVSEEVIGYLRSAAGKARLLSTQKMVQFEGLCHKNVKPPPNDTCPTKLQDLQGFWDMVMLQVEDIHQLFAEIDTMRANSWKVEPITQSSSLTASSTTAVTNNNNTGSCMKSTPANKRAPTSRQTPSTPSPAALMAAQKREEQRKQLAELKKQFRMQQISAKTPDKETNDDIVIIKH